MYYVGAKQVDNTMMHEFKYSYPLGKGQVSNDAEFLAYFTEDSNQESVSNMILNTLQIKAKTLNQFKLVEAVNKNDMVFAIGPAGTGKTYTGVALAVRALKAKQVKRIICHAH